MTVLSTTAPDGRLTFLLSLTRATDVALTTQRTHTAAFNAFKVHCKRSRS